MNTKFSKNLYNIMMCYAEALKEFQNMEFPALHDPTTIAYAISPHIFKVKQISLNKNPKP